MKRRISTVHFRDVATRTEIVDVLGHSIEIEHIGCNGDLAEMAARISVLDSKVDAIALQGVSRRLQLGRNRVEHAKSAELFAIARTTPVVDGAGVRAAMERWAIRLAAEQQPGIWSRKRVLMVPGLNHHGMAEALSQYTQEIQYADPVVFFALPGAPIIGSRESLARLAGPTLGQLRDLSLRRLYPAGNRPPRRTRSARPFEWADVIAGDINSIRRYAPDNLKHKLVVAECASELDVKDLEKRGVTAVVTTMPPFGGELAQMSAATFEACLAALRASPDSPLTENTYLNLMASMDWRPGIKFLQPETASINRFAFVIHPLSTDFILQHKWFRWARILPRRLVERVAANIPPLYISRIKGIQSPATGQKTEGILIALGATPRELMRRDPAFAYRRLIRASRMAERLGARLMGLGAFTSVVGDAGITVAQKADIAITSGNSLTVAATLESAKQAVVKMGNSLEESHTGNVMVIGATGSIGSVCSRLLAQAGPAITLVAPRPEKLIALKQTIESETPSARVRISTTADDYVGDADLIVTTTTALNTRIVDIMKCKPGAVICDIARPPDITAEEAALRPDVLVIESGEILLPGEPDYGYNIGLPPGVAYACLAETALLAMEGRFEDFTLGRDIEMERVKEIYRLYKKHGLQLSGIRSHGKFLTDEDLALKRSLADELRQNPERLAQLSSKEWMVRELPVGARVIGATREFKALLVGSVIGAAVLAWRIGRRLGSRVGPEQQRLEENANEQ